MNKTDHNMMLNIYTAEFIRFVNKRFVFIYISGCVWYKAKKTLLKFNISLNFVNLWNEKAANIFRHISFWRLF